MNDAPLSHKTLPLSHLSSGESLVWSAEADSETVKKAARSRSRLIKIFYAAILLGTLLLLIAAIYLMQRSGPAIYLSLLLFTFLFALFAFILRRQLRHDREIARTPGPIIYAVTDKNFLIILGESGKVRRYGPKAFKRIRVRPNRRSDGGQIQFAWKRQDIGGKYSETLYLKNDPIRLGEVLHDIFGADIRS